LLDWPLAVVRPVRRGAGLQGNRIAASGERLRKHGKITCGGLRRAQRAKYIRTSRTNAKHHNPHGSTIYLRIVAIIRIMRYNQDGGKDERDEHGVSKHGA